VKNVKRKSLLCVFFWALCAPAVLAQQVPVPAARSNTSSGEALPAVTAPGPSGNSAAAQTRPEEKIPALDIPELMIYGEEALVTTATRHLQKLSEVPGNVTIITAQEIRERNALTLSDILLNFTGADLTHEGIFETVRFRGMQSAYNNKILVLLDGRKLNTIDWGNFNDTFGNNLDAIKQIEIIKGPGSALYGANAFAGVINIITKDGADLGGLYTKLSVGTKNGDEELSRYLFTAYGRRDGAWDFVADAGYWAEHGLDLINSTPNDFYEGDHFDVAVKQADRFSLRAGFHKSQEAYQGLFFSPTPKQRAYQDTLYLDNRVVWELNDLSKVTARVEDTYYLKRDIRQTNFTIPRHSIASASDLPPGAAIIVEDSGQTHPVTDAVGWYYIDQADALSLLTGRALTYLYWTGPENELLGEVQYDLAWPADNYLLAGISYTHDWSGQNYFRTPTVWDQNYAAYVQDEYHAWENLLLLAGARFDYNTAYGSNLSPRGSLIYTFWPGFRLKALYGSAFRAPVFLERYAGTTVGFVEGQGNEKLKPERTQQSEVSVEYELGKWLQAKGGYFYWETQDEIQPLPERVNVYVYSPDLSQINPSFPAQPGLYYNNILNNASANLTLSNNNSRLGRGFELEATTHPLPYAKLSVNYTHYTLYLMRVPPSYIVDEGDSDLINGILGFNYENRVFVNFYAHLGCVPRTVEFDARYNNGARIVNIWLNQFDVSAGVRLKGVNLTASIYNCFENDLTYDQVGNHYVKGPRVLRLTADYTYAF